MRHRRPECFARSLVALIAGVSIGAAVRAQPGPELVQPQGSGLAFERQDPAVPAASFSGHTTIHGILVAQWHRSPENEAELRPFFHLLPVPQSARRLPHFLDQPVVQMAVTNGMRALEQASSTTIAAEFARRERPVIHVEGIFSITGFSIGKPCLAAATVTVEDVDPVRVRFPPRAEPVVCPIR
jgi:hypothetical protein